MSKQMEFVAVCQYQGHDQFRFYSEPFLVEHWSDLDAEGCKVVEAAWARISPHPPPPVIDYLPGALVYVPLINESKSIEGDGR